LKGNKKMKTFMVTGAAMGIGRAVVIALAKAGDTAVLNDVLQTDELNALVVQLEGMGVKVKLALGDVALPETALNAFADLDGLDILVNNAGILGEVSITEMSAGVWDNMIRVHLYGTFLFSREAAKLMSEQGSGCIVNMASDLGQLGCANLCHYSAAKAGIIGFTKALARELASKNIRVNAVAPGGTLTPMVEKLGAAYIKEEAERYPMKRLGSAEEIAHVVAFLSSEYASFITGQVLGVNGGGVMNG